MPNNRTGEDYLDKGKKKKFNYKEQKAILDARTERSRIIGEHLKQERLEKEARKKAREQARKEAEEHDKKTYPQGVTLQRKAKVKQKAVKLKQKAVKLKYKKK